MASSLAPQNGSFGSSHDLVMKGWEAKENHDGVVYFVNNELKITSWLHPYVSKVFEELGEYNDIKYAAYRTALKLRSLQVKFGLSWISIKSIKTVFANTSVTVNEYENGGEDILSCREVFMIVHSILEMSDYLHLHKNHLLKASEIILNFFLELYDTNRSGKLAKRSITIALVALCSAKLSEKYRFFFDMISNYQGHIQREKFLYLIYDMMQITELMKESTAFGTNVSAAVNSCLDTGDYSSRERCEDLFYSWLLREPQTLIWLPTLHRVVATETIRHDIQCSVCRAYPMVGFRYRCMQCLSYDLCQTCFFHGFFSQSHRLKHPMQEYCFPLTRKDNTKALLKIMRNKMSKKHRQSKIKYLPVDDDSITGSVFQWQPRSLIPDPRDSFCGSTDSGLTEGSGSGELQPMSTRSANQLDEDVAMMKKWQKPVDVLGEPCDTSSPCLQQENLTKKNMDVQQLKMAQTIQELQEENRMLRQKLTTFRKRELEDDDESEREGYHVSEEIVIVEVQDKNLAGDPLKEISTNGPISPIKSEKHLDGQLTGHDAFATRTKYESNEQDASVDVLQIVGSCTPIPSSFCVENKESSDSNESGINAEEISSDSISTSSRFPANRDDLIRNKPVFALQICTDTETESTTSNDLEYTYSDMSLKSEASSRPRSTKSEQMKLKAVDQTDGSVKGIYCISTCNTTSTSNTLSYITPNTTRNETVELDAFKLCRMKFGNVDDVSKKLDRHDSASSQPRLIYTSSSEEIGNSVGHRSPDLRSDSFQASRILLSNGANSMSSQLHSIDFASFDLSEIPAQGSHLSFSNGAKSLVSNQPLDTGRRKTLEPVYMSTPVTGKNPVPHKSTLRKRSESDKAPRKRREKENKAPPLYGHDSTRESVMFQSVKALSVYNATPTSSIPPWQRQRILHSVDGHPSNRSYSCNDLPTEGEMGMTTMFDKAEYHRTTGAGGNSLPLEDKKELEKMIEQVRIGDSHCSDLPACGNVSDSSMLKAVMNIGDAMADFVQATAEVHMQKESTNF